MEYSKSDCAFLGVLQHDPKYIGYMYLQQQKENPQEIIFHEEINFPDRPIYFAKDEYEDDIYAEAVGNEWLIDYCSQTMSFKSPINEEKSLEPKNSLNQKEACTKPSEPIYEEEYER